jgi:hypothetical protein
MIVRATVDDVLLVPLQDGATIARGIVIAADEQHFTIRLETKFPGAEVEYEQETPGVVLVADG